MKRIPIVAAAATALALVVGACSSGGGSKTAVSRNPNPPPSAVPTTAGGANPNAPEVNPAGDIPDNQAFVAYAPPSAGYGVKVPEGWARSEAGGAVVFTDKLNSIRMEAVPAGSAPSVQSVEQDEVPTIRAASQNFEPGRVREVTRKAGKAILVTYRADSAPDAVTGKVIHLDVERYEFWRSGREVVVLTLSGPVGADNVDPWRIVTDSFGWQS